MDQSISGNIADNCQQVADLMRALAHPRRLLILCELMSGEKNVNALVEACGASQSSMSQFLQRMTNEGLVESRREQTFVYYAIKDERLIQLLKAIKDLYCPGPKRENKRGAKRGERR